MATTRLMPLHTGKGRTVGNAIAKIIDYVENPEKTDHGKLITSWQCDSRVADAEFLYTKQQYIKKTGKVRGTDDVIAYHLRQSFRPGEITPEEANRVGCELANRFTKGNHAFIVCTHIDKAHIHNHIIWNSTALNETRKFRNFWGSTKAIRRLNDTICIENGYSIVENPKGKGKTYDEWLGDIKKPSHRERICAAIDSALLQNPQSFEELLDLLKQAGYQVKDGKVPSLFGGEQQRFIRMDTLGDEYSPTVLRAVIAGQKAHKPRQKKALRKSFDKPSGNLVIDMQAVLQSKKGAAYENWAKRHNLKQAATTLRYLQENKLTSYSDLETKAAAATTKCTELRRSIKTAEDSMKEISIIQKHISDYHRTRKTYVAYQKAGYSKKYLAAHEADILIHKACKKFFDELGGKLPSYKSLEIEYATLLVQKKKAYSEYQKAKKEMEVLQIAKANVDSMFKPSDLRFIRHIER